MTIRDQVADYQAVVAMQYTVKANPSVADPAA